MWNPFSVLATGANETYSYLTGPSFFLGEEICSTNWGAAALFWWAFAFCMALIICHLFCVVWGREQILRGLVNASPQQRPEIIKEMCKLHGIKFREDWEYDHELGYKRGKGWLEQEYFLKRFPLWNEEWEDGGLEIETENAKSETNR
jgi:hypothetical protein